MDWELMVSHPNQLKTQGVTSQSGSGIPERIPEPLNGLSLGQD